MKNAGSNALLIVPPRITAGFIRITALAAWRRSITAAVRIVALKIPGLDPLRSPGAEALVAPEFADAVAARAGAFLAHTVAAHLAFQAVFAGRTPATIIWTSS